MKENECNKQMLRKGSNNVCWSTCDVNINSDSILLKEIQAKYSIYYSCVLTQ